MDRVIMSVATFAAVFSTVVVGAVLLSLGGVLGISGLPTYGVAALLGVEAARRVFRRLGSRRWFRDGTGPLAH